MAKLFLLGRNGGLYPTGRVSADAVAKEQGKEGMWEGPKRPRNLQHHKKWLWVFGRYQLAATG